MDVVTELVGAREYGDAAVASISRDARYECVFRAAEDAVSSGVSAVAVAPFTRECRDPDAWSGVESRFSELGAHAVLVWIDVDPQEIARRMRGRAATRDSLKLADLDGYLATLDTARPEVPHIAVDGTAPADVQATRVRRALLG